jgi:hypothetical protein
LITGRIVRISTKAIFKNRELNSAHPSMLFDGGILISFVIVVLAYAAQITNVIRGTAADTTLRVHTYQLDASATSRKGPALGAGVQIQIDGKNAGVTDATGTLSTSVTPGPLNIVGRIPAKAVGTVEVTIADGQTLDVDLFLDFDKEAIEDATLSADEITNQLLDASFATLTLRFKSNVATVPVKSIDSIDLLDREGNAVSRLEASFSACADGVIHASNISSLRTQFQKQQGIIALRVMASAANGLVYENDVSFYLAQFKVSGTLVAPPSFPTLNNAGIKISMTLLGTPFMLTAITGVDGSFAFPRFPRGTIALNSSTQQQGKFYYGQGQLLLNRDSSVSVVMRNEEDVKNGVKPLTVTSAGAPIP